MGHSGTALGRFWMNYYLYKYLLLTYLQDVVVVVSLVSLLSLSFLAWNPNRVIILFPISIHKCVSLFDKKAGHRDSWM